MSFPFSDKFSYVKDRFVNALWMIRNGKLDLIVKSIYIEVSHRVMQLKVLLLHGRNPDYSKLPGSELISISAKSFRRATDPQFPDNRRCQYCKLINKLSQMNLTASCRDSLVEKKANHDVDYPCFRSYSHIQCN